MGQCSCTDIDSQTLKKHAERVKSVEQILYVNYYEPPTYNESLPKLKLVFLDVDGVLHNRMYGFQKVFFDYLKVIITKTNCKIVIDSTWRLNENMRSQLIDALLKYCNYTMDELNELIIGDTPDLTSSFYDPMKQKSIEIKYDRAHEIDSFLRSKKIRDNYNVITWVALDDKKLDAKELNYFASDIMKGHFVLVDENSCLNKHNVKDAINILNSQDSDNSCTKQ